MRQRPGWRRFNGPSGGTCGGRWVSYGGHAVQHCGHPTAHCPYTIETPESDTVIDGTGRAFRKLIHAQKAAEGIEKGLIRVLPTSNPLYHVIDRLAIDL